MKKKQHPFYGFTLIEIIIVIGVISILAGIVILAVNPKRQIAITENSKRMVVSREIQNALSQFVLDGNKISGAPVGLTETLTMHICQEGGGAGCIDLTPLVTLNYIAAIPVDVKATAPLSGFEVTFHPSGPTEVEPEYLEPISDDDDGPCSTETSDFPPEQDGFLVPYEITNCSQLQQMTGNNKYVLTNDIDCSATNPADECHTTSLWGTYGQGEGFIPISTTSNFSFDGNGYTIHDLFINKPFDTEVGLFSALVDVAPGCCNVTLEDVYISGDGQVGGLAGTVQGSQIENVKVSGAVSGGLEVGGIVGRLATNTVLRGVSFTGTVSAEANIAGGIVGGMLGGDVSVEDCFSIGSVNALGNAGGIVGQSFNFLQSVRRCYNASSVNATSMNSPAAGGLVGVTNNSSPGFPAIAVDESYNIGTVLLGVAGFAGGIAGAGLISDDSNTYWFDFPEDNAFSCGGTSPFSCIKETSPDVFYGAAHPVYASWDFQNVWQEHFEALPTLR